MHRPSDHSRLYVAVRGDLPLGLAAAQAVHAACQLAMEHPEHFGAWMLRSQYLVIVTVPDEIDLIGLTSRANAEGLACALWHEPDRDGEATAVALEPGDRARRLCANLPLFGREMALV